MKVEQLKKILCAKADAAKSSGEEGIGIDV